MTGPKRGIAVLLSRIDESGPSRGAVALCNALAEHLPVTIYLLKQEFVISTAGMLRENVRYEYLGGLSLIDRYRRVRASLQADIEGFRCSISFGLSADVVNAFASRVIRISSMRSNLFQDYRYAWGIPGLLIALLHMLLLHRMRTVVVMTHSMRRLARRMGLTTVVIGNFVEEPSLEPFVKTKRVRDLVGEKRIVYVGSLTRRKAVDVLLRAVAELSATNPFVLDIVGSGPELGALKRECETLGIERLVTFHGHVSEPYNLVSRADVFVLPSRSEGASRAMLEALFLGVPCIARDVDGNAEVLGEAGAGLLFRRDAELGGAIKRLLNPAKKSGDWSNLLAPNFRRKIAVRRYLDCIQRVAP